MFKISTNGIVSVNRGDSFELPIVLNIGSAMTGEVYKLSKTDAIYLGIMEPNQRFEDAIIRKKVTSADEDVFGNLYVRFWPEDTVNVLPGKYYYQVKLQTVDAATGRLDAETVIDKTLFFIEE